MSIVVSPRLSHAAAVVARRAVARGVAPHIYITGSVVVNELITGQDGAASSRHHARRDDVIADYVSARSTIEQAAIEACF